jgi:uncharacterized protein YsxB (DUF464 family)
MASLKRYCNLRANSIVESVIALCIISVCLYIAVLVFAAVFTPRTSAKFYNTQNKVNELFFLAQLNDSLMDQNANEDLIMEEENLGAGLKKITVHYKDSLNVGLEKSFYVSQ